VLIYVALQFWLAGQSGGKDSAWELLPIGVFVAAIAADIAIRMSTVVRLTPSDLEVGPWWLPHKVVPRKSVRGVALRGVFSRLGTTLYAVIYDEQNRSVATLPEGIWDEGELKRLQVLLPSKDRATHYVSAADLSREFPGALTIVRYAGWVLAIVVIALVFVGVALERQSGP
jgi:hypothetical protein